MNMQNAAYIVGLIIASIISALLAGYAYLHRREKTGAVAYIGLALASALYSFGYAFEIASPTPEDVVFWLKVEYIGIALLPAMWSIMAMEYVGADKYLTRPVVAGLFIIPAITLILHYTNDLHHLFYYSVDVDMSGPFSVAILVKGPWYWVNLTYLYLAIIGGNILFWRMWRRAAPFYRWQAASMLVGSFMPLGGNLLYLTGNSPWGLDLSPFMIALSSPLYAWGLVRSRLLDLVPVARDKVIEGLRDGVLVLDVQNRIVDFNPAALSIMPELSKNAIGKSVRTVLFNYPGLIQQITLGTHEYEIKIIRAKENVLYFTSRLSPVTNRKGQLVGRTIVLSDTTEKVLLLDKLHSLASIDDLTQVYNRRCFRDVCHREVERAKRLQKPIAMIMMDIDYFKRVNDNYGHEAGDIVLIALTQECQEHLRSADVFGRYGGEEFAICLPDTSSGEAYQIAERLRHIIAEKTISVEGTDIAITLSLGVATAMETAQADVDRLLKEADQAMYEAKESGRNRVVSYQRP